MTRERINDFKEIVLPSISKLLFDVNYEGQGKCDAEEFAKDFKEILDLAAKALKQEPCGDTVSREVFEQVVWERDTAIEQLRKLGYELGQKIEPCDDCVSRQALLEFFKDDDYVVNEINNMPSVTPKREQGEWIFEEVGVRTQVLKCSKCGTIIQRGENFTQEEFKKYINDILREKCITLDNFCHNCGAEMR